VEQLDLSMREDYLGQTMKSQGCASCHGDPKKEKGKEYKKLEDIKMKKSKELPPVRSGGDA